MPLGIDVGARTVRVATSQGTARHSNGIRRASDGTDAAEGADAAEGTIVVETDDGNYVVGGDDAGTDTGDDESVGRLFGDESGAPAAVRGTAVEAFLTAVADGDVESEHCRYVAREGGAGPLATVATRLGGDAAPVDAGLAVVYDVMDAPATGLGVALADDRAVGTLAVAGVPVATASLDVDDDWFDLARDRSGTPEGPTADWLARQYETLFADLGARLATSAPALVEDVPVAVGGETAPASVEGLADPLAAALPVGVEGVTVADDPDASLARGALVAAGADDGTEAPLPPFAADVPFVGALVDFGAAAGAVGDGARGAVGGTGEAASQAVGNGRTDENLEQAVASTRADLATLDRRGAMTARGVSDLADRLEGEDAAGVESLRDDLESLEARLPDDAALESFEDDLSGELDALRERVGTIRADLDDLDATAASVETVDDLEASLDSLEAAVADLEDNTESIRAAVAGLDPDADVDVPEGSGEGVDALRAEALQDDIEDVEADLSDRIEGLWSELDELEGRVVDLEATAREVPDLESTVSSTRDTVADLESEAENLRESIDSLGSDLETTRAETSSMADLRAVESDVDDLAADVESLRETVESTDRVDPSTVEAIENDIDGLRQTLITRADRLDGLEDTVEDLRERIETVYGNSAKSEALSSLQTETSRIRQTAARAMERTDEMTETVGELGETVDAHDEQLGMLSTNVDNLAGSSVTRSEMDAAIDRVEDRFDEAESDIRSELEAVRTLAEESESDVEPVEEEGNEDLVVVLQAVAFVALGLFGAIVAFNQQSVLVAGGFLVFAIMPGVLSWLIG